MRELLDKTKEAILSSPAFKTAAFVFSTILSGALASALIVEISAPNTLNWTSFYKARSFYGLLVLGVTIYFYNRATYLHERDILRFLDNEYCIAYLRSKLLPEMAEKVRKKIREGTGGELKEAMDELRKVLK